jgi:hypothetical protein
MSNRKSGRNADGTFGPGNCGKPKGTRHKATLAAMALLDGEAESLSRKAVELALQGDTTALRLCLERIAPPRKDAPVTFDLPPLLMETLPRPRARISWRWLRLIGGRLRRQP